MLYVADLRRDGLLKVGVTARGEGERRLCELRTKLSAPKLAYIRIVYIPRGWGSDTEWERRLLETLRRNSSNLQLFSEAERSEEVVDATPDDACRELNRLLIGTEVNPNSTATELPLDKEDWRFVQFMERMYPEARYALTGYSSHHWRDRVTRQVFLYWLRKEPTARWERLTLGYSSAEIEDL